MNVEVWKYLSSSPLKTGSLISSLDKVFKSWLPSKESLHSSFGDCDGNCDGDGDGDGDDRYDDRDGDGDGDDRDDDCDACMDPACIIAQSRWQYHPGAHSCSTNRLNLGVLLSRLLQVPKRGTEFTTTDHCVQLKQGPKHPLVQSREKKGQG